MNKSTLNDELPEKSVTDYLRRHPDFFTYHEELLAKMEIPHAAKGNAISLIEKQLSVLRDENRHLQHQLENLILIAQHNEQLNQKIQRLITVLAAVNHLDEFFDTLYQILPAEFNTEATVIRLFMPPPPLIERPEFVEYDAQIFLLFENILEGNQLICGRLSDKQHDFLFPENNVASVVLIPLGIPKPQGLLAMGSREVSRFHSGMSTDLLRYMGELISHLLQMWLRLL